MKDSIAPQTQIAFHNLNGLIHGIAIDGHISKSEFDALKSWCQTHESICKEEPFHSFYSEIRDIIKSGILGSEEIFELKSTIQKFKNDFEEKDHVKSDLHYLQGLVYGIIVDGDINKYELNLLHNWLLENSHLKTKNPFDEFFETIRKAKEKKTFSPEEYKQLMNFLKKFLKYD